MPELVDETAFEIATEFVAVETDTYVPIDDTPAYEETWAEPESDSDARADSSLDDLVDEVPRRGAEPDLPDGSDTTDDLLRNSPAVPDVIDDSSEPAAAPYVFEDAPTAPPVDEPPRRRTSRRRAGSRRAAGRGAASVRPTGAGSAGRRAVRGNAAHVGSRRDRKGRADS